MSDEMMKWPLKFIVGKHEVVYVGKTIVIPYIKWWSLR